MREGGIAITKPASRNVAAAESKQNRQKACSTNACTYKSQTLARNIAATSSIRNVPARRYPKAAKVAKAKAQKYAIAPNRATGIPPIRAYELPSTRKQSGELPQTAVSPVSACTAR